MPTTKTNLIGDMADGSAINTDINRREIPKFRTMYDMWIKKT